jgi:hypothetical protein
MAGDCRLYTVPPSSINTCISVLVCGDLKVCRVSMTEGGYETAKTNFKGWPFKEILSDKLVNTRNLLLYINRICTFLINGNVRE